MAAQFDSNPAELYTLANQILIYAISDDGGTVASTHRFIVQVFENTTEIAKLYLTANTNSKAFFDLSSIVRERVKVDSNDYAQSETVHDIEDVTPSKYGTRKFQVKVGTYDGSSETLAEATKTIYLVDGTFQIRDSQVPSFGNYYPTTLAAPYNKSWLTERWADKYQQATNDTVDYYFADEDEGVAAWIHDSNIISGIDDKVYLALFNDSGMIGYSDHTITSLGGEALTSTDYDKKVHYIGIAPASVGWASNLPSANPDWTYYLIRLQDNRDQCSKYLRVYRDCGTSKNQRVQIAYANRLGGWDYLAFEGNAEKTETVQNKTYNKALGDWDASTFTFLKSARTVQPYQITAKTKYKLKAYGWNKENYYQLQGLLQSENVMMRYSSGDDKELNDRKSWLPVVVTTKSSVIRDKEQSQIFDVSIEVELAQDIRC